VELVIVTDRLCVCGKIHKKNINNNDNNNNNNSVTIYELFLKFVCRCISTSVRWVS
jgi:hypothetical protein